MTTGTVAYSQIWTGSPSFEALKEQIMRDVAQAKRYLHLMRLMGKK